MDDWKKISNELKLYVGSCNAIKSITREVMKKCEKRDVFHEENVVALAVNLLSLDPSNGFNFDADFDRRSIEGFVNKCLDFFLGKYTKFYIIV